MARTLVESGATQLVILDLNAGDAQSSADELAAWFVAEGEATPGEIEAVGLGCDVSNEASVQEAFKKIEEKFGRVDILVTAAGIVENFPAAEYPTAKVKKLLDINVMGTWFCTREAARLMPDGGSQVLIGSMSGSIVNIPQPQTPYNFSSEYRAAPSRLSWHHDGLGDRLENGWEEGLGVGQNGRTWRTGS